MFAGLTHPAENAERASARLGHGDRHLRILNEVGVAVSLDNSLFQFDFGKSLGVNRADERKADKPAFGNAGRFNRLLAWPLEIGNGDAQNVVAADAIIAGIILEIIGGWIARTGEFLILG